MVNDYMAIIHILSVRPEFTSDGPLAIKQGRHPILEKKVEPVFTAVCSPLLFI